MSKLLLFFIGFSLPFATASHPKEKIKQTDANAIEIDCGENTIVVSHGGIPNVSEARRMMDCLHLDEPICTIKTVHLNRSK